MYVAYLHLYSHFFTLIVSTIALQLLLHVTCDCSCSMCLMCKAGVLQVDTHCVYGHRRDCHPSMFIMCNAQGRCGMQVIIVCFIPFVANQIAPHVLRLGSPCSQGSKTAACPHMHHIVLSTWVCRRCKPLRTLQKLPARQLLCGNAKCCL